MHSFEGTAQTISIDIEGTNGATFSGDAAGDVTEDNPTIASGTLSVADVNDGENTFLATDGGSHAGSNGYGTFTFDTSTGEWTYTLNSNAAVDALNTGDPPLHDTYTVHSLDGTAQIIDVTINGVTDVATPPGGGNPPSDPDTSNDHDTDTTIATTGIWNASTSGDDIKVGDIFGNTINGGNGDDKLYGGAGSDTLNGNNHKDTVYGQADDGTINGGKGDDIIYGGSATRTPFRVVAVPITCMAVAATTILFIPRLETASQPTWT